MLFPLSFRVRYPILHAKPHNPSCYKNDFFVRLFLLQQCSFFLRHHRTNSRLKIEPSDKKMPRPLIRVNGVSPWNEGKLNSLTSSSDVDQGAGSKAEITVHWPCYPTATKAASGTRVLLLWCLISSVTSPSSKAKVADRSRGFGGFFGHSANTQEMLVCFAWSLLTQDIKLSYQWKTEFSFWNICCIFSFLNNNNMILRCFGVYFTMPGISKLYLFSYTLDKNCPVLFSLPVFMVLIH